MEYAATSTSLPQNQYGILGPKSVSTITKNRTDENKCLYHLDVVRVPVRLSRNIDRSPLDKETKYKAKNTVDVPVYRGADAIAAQVNSTLTSSGVGITGVAILGAAVAAAWAYLGWWLGREYQVRIFLREPATSTDTRQTAAAKQ